MKKCKICGKETKRIVKGMCLTHYNQMNRNGEISIRTILDRNEIIKYDSYAEMVLYDYKCKEKARTKIDLDDIETIIKYKWSCQSVGYVQHVTPMREMLLLHRFIMNAPKGKYVDHINHDTLDNRRSNLRIVTPHQSNLNQHIRSDNTSGHKGVSWYERDLMWESYINTKGKKIFLGKFKELQDAIDARKEAEDKYFDSKYIKE